jgi:hypothetical protein
LGTEIPPLVFFNNDKKIEVIDGRQRFETIKRFIGGEFHLTNKGLHILKYLAKKNFNELPSDITENFWDTTLRIIKFGVVKEPKLDERSEDLIKKQIFRRYNSGITPLKNAEIDKAMYITDDTTVYFKKQLKENNNDYRKILSLLFLEKYVEFIDKPITLEKVMSKIRLSLIMHNFPIHYYSTLKGRSDIADKFFEYLSENTRDVSFLYNSFIEKINILWSIKQSFDNSNKGYNTLVFECILWGLTILENEKISLAKFKSKGFINEVVDYFSKNIDTFKTENSHFAKEFNDRYYITALFIKEKFNINIDMYLYLNNSIEFKKKLSIIEKSRRKIVLSDYETLRLNKPDASTTTIENICRLMNRQRFLLRPIYQREEAINRQKSSAIIESILLGIKLPPIFVYKRADGISEVVDGQQRLLSILGYIGESFVDENGQRKFSEKNGYSLTKLTILDEHNNKSFKDLNEDLQTKIIEFNLSIINIDAKINPQFDPIDLFIRLNNKPYPIRENTFEMWNSYIDNEIINKVKENWKDHMRWFYILINNRRMENEELYTSLAYLNYKEKSNTCEKNDYLDIYQRGNNINFRMKDKVDITKVLNSASINKNSKDEFIKSIKDIENFIRKLKMVIIDKQIDDDLSYANEELNKIMNVVRKSRRTLQSFYALWYLINPINSEMIRLHRLQIKSELSNIFNFTKNIETENGVDQFGKIVNTFWDKYKVSRRKIVLKDDEKKNLIEKQNNMCPLCNAMIFNGDEIEIDHKKPIAVGGRDSFINLQVVHKECNRKKRSQFIR